MKLLYIHQYFVFPDTPGATRSYDLATSFVQPGYKVVVITSSSFLEGEFRKGWTVINRDGIEVHVLRSQYSNQLSFYRRIVIFFAFMLHTTFRVLKINANLVIATSTPITVAVPALVKRLFQGTRFIFETRDVWPEAPVALGAIKNKLLVRIVEAFEKYVYMRAEHIVALSVDMKDSILKRTNTPAEKISVIPNIANISRFSRVDPRESILKMALGFVPVRSVLYAGTFGVVNGVDNLVDFFREVSLRDPEIKFIFTGWGSRKATLVKLCNEAKLTGETVFFLPPVAKDRIPQLYSECSVTSSFVIPVKELWYNSANKFFDSLAAGKPIVINYDGWQAGVIRKNDIGFVLPHEKNKLLEAANEFCVYLQNSALLNTQGVKAKQLAEREYSLELTAAKYLQVIQNSLKKK